MGVDDSGFKRKMDNLRNNAIPRINTRSIAALALFTEREMKKEAPIQTGRLRNSIEALIQRDRATVGTSVFYGIMVARGTKPHLIEPRNKKALSWVGAPHPARRVNHPGTKANPFDLRALATLKAEAKNIVNQVKRNETAQLR